MKLLSSIFALLLFAAPAAALAPDSDATARAAQGESQTERTVSATKDVKVELSLASGDVIVRGWDRDEVLARSDDAPRIEVRTYDSAPASEPKGQGAAPGREAPARRVEVFVLHSKDEQPRPGEFSGSGNVELRVPRGATIFLQVQSGDIEIANVAEARVETASGDIALSGITKAIEVDAFSGDVSVSDCFGSVRLRSLSGSVEATNLKPNDDRDSFAVQSISGNISLEGVTHTKVEGVTTSGSVSFEGSLAQRGGYKLQTTSGDVTMRLPATASFRVNARVILGGEIITDFVVKSDARSDPSSPVSRLDGVVGTGDAEISLLAHNGTVHLRKN